MLSSTCRSRLEPFKAQSIPVRVVRRYARPFVVRAQACPSLRNLLDDAASAGLGKVRFILLGEGAILESVNNWDSVRYKEVPGRGMLATIASEDRSFECSIMFSKIKEVRFARSKAKTGDYDIYATRFLGEGGKGLLTCLLHGSQGVYESTAVTGWCSLMEKYGESITFAD